MFQLAENRQETGKELRSCVVETLQELMREDDKVTDPPYNIYNLFYK